MSGTRYLLSFADAKNHLIDVEATYLTTSPVLRLSMAVWTPGSYMVREYSRHIEGVQAFANGSPVAIEKEAKNRWMVTTGGASEITVRYRLYARELTVRTNYVDESFALINGAPTFLVSDEGKGHPHVVRIALPPAWNHVATALRAAQDGTYVADNYDTLIDSPIAMGTRAAQTFDVRGVPHDIVHVGDPKLWDTTRANADVAKIVETAAAMWGFLPYPRYVFINAITEGKGGLEHGASTVMMTSRFAYRSRKDYVDWLGLVAHEYFHTWNIKRLRPVALGPFDYERENYTTSLWIAEGFTAYYDDLLVHRAGLSTRAEYLERMGKNIQDLETTPGRQVQSLERASFDAWIKYYRPDENTTNTAVSYYIKGAILAFLLDQKIRAASKGARSLDDVMRRAYERFSGQAGFEAREFDTVIDEVAGEPLSRWLVPLRTGTQELDYQEALAFYGLRFAPSKPVKPDEPHKGWLGVTTRNEGGRLIVKEVLRGAPAYAAGLAPDDEIVALDGYRVGSDLDERLKQYPPGTELRVLVARRQKLEELTLTLGDLPKSAWKVEEDEGASPEAKKRLSAWLSGARA